MAIASNAETKNDDSVKNAKTHQFVVLSQNAYNTLKFLNSHLLFHHGLTKFEESITIEISSINDKAEYGINFRSIKNDSRLFITLQSKIFKDDQEYLNSDPMTIDTKEILSGEQKNPTQPVFLKRFQSQTHMIKCFYNRYGYNPQCKDQEIIESAKDQVIRSDYSIQNGDSKINVSIKLNIEEDESDQMNLMIVNQGKNMKLDVKKLEIESAPQKIDIKVGSGFNIISDNVLGYPIYQFSGRTQSTKFGFEIPVEVDIHMVNTSFEILETLSSMEDFIRKRKADLSGSANVDIIGGNTSGKIGHLLSSDTSKELYKNTVLLERCVFKLTINEEKLQLNSLFKKDIDELPDEYVKHDEANFDRWRKFFSKYGTHFIKIAYGGGSIMATVKSASKNVDEDTVAEFSGHIESHLSIGKALSGLDNVKSKKVVELFNTTRFHMEGGNPNLHVTNLESLTDVIRDKWLASIEDKPSILTTKLDLIPIDTIVSSYRPGIRDTVSLVYKDLFGTFLKYTPFKDKTLEPENMIETSTNATPVDTNTSRCTIV